MVKVKEKINELRRSWIDVLDDDIIRRLKENEEIDVDDFMDEIERRKKLFAFKTLSKRKLKKAIKHWEAFILEMQPERGSDRANSVLYIAGEAYAHTIMAYGVALGDEANKPAKKHGLASVINEDVIKIIGAVAPALISAGAFIYISKLGYEYEIEGVEDPETGERTPVIASRPLQRVLNGLRLK